MKEKHHHHKNEMMHHKVRHQHKSAHHQHKMKEHSSHPHMHEHGHSGSMSHMIGGVVHDDHQEGIHRVIQRKGDMQVNQHGSMAKGWKHEHSKMPLTPRKG